MIKLENYEVMGWEHAIRGMRNPMNSWEKGDSGWDAAFKDQLLHSPTDYTHVGKYIEGVEIAGDYEYDIGPNDQDLMMRLRNAGTDHRKYMRMITVYVDITAPLYWWKEFDTYKVGTVANSCSTMHKIHEKEFTLEDFSCECLKSTLSRKVLCATINSLNTLRLVYLNGGVEDSDEGYFADLDLAKIQELPGNQYIIHDPKSKDIWYEMIQLLPSSYNQKRTIMLNYEVLANMYKSRKNHKLDEWREFCQWIEKLPYSEMITGGKEE